MARYEAAKTVLSPKGRGSGVIKRKSSDDKNPVVKKEDLITVFSEDDDSSPKTYKKAREYASELQRETRGMKKGGAVKSSASKRADGIAMKGKTKGRMV